MAYKKFRLFLVLRLMLIVALATLATVLFMRNQHFSFSLVLLFILVASAETTYFVNRTYRDIENMVRSISANDFSLRFKSSIASRTPIQFYSNAIIQKMKLLYTEKEKSNELMYMIIDHIPAGVICFRNLNDCILLNPTAKQFLGSEIILHLNHLKSKDPVLGILFETMQTGQRERIKLKRHTEEFEIAVTRVDYSIGEHSIQLYTLENISADMDRKETESWQHLMRVLNHEIVNSITPIVSLSASLHESLKTGENEFSDEEFKQGIAAISRRSEHLLRFATGYRTFTSMNKPFAIKIQLNEFIHHIVQSLSKESGNRIQIKRSATDAVVFCDEIQLGQILNNLIRNAIEAIPSTKEAAIEIQILHESSNNGFSITDNGEGMADEVLGKVFVPYFTTKENGHGIGLSLCRQLVLANKGRMTIQSKSGHGTTVNVMLPQADLLQAE